MYFLINDKKCSQSIILFLMKFIFVILQIQIIMYIRYNKIVFIICLFILLTNYPILKEVLYVNWKF